MDKRKSLPLQYLSYQCVIITSCLGFIFSSLDAQVNTFDGKTFKPYKSAYFKPKRGLQYNLYLSTLLTVDPLGIGGKSTYALGIGSRINIWESKVSGHNLQGLKITGFYTGFGYDLYPQQSDDVYASLWLRLKTFMPITGKIDVVYSYGNELKGLSSRYCVGFEIKNIAVLLTGSIHNFTSPVFGDHPHLNSPYSNVGSIMLIVPVYKHFPVVK